MPSVQSFYQILSQLTVLLYLIMYMLMFSAAIVLRYKMKDTPPVPSGQEKRPDVAPRMSRLLRRIAGLRPELRAAQPDRNGQQHRLVLGARHRMRGRRGRPVRDLRPAQAVVESPQAAAEFAPSTGKCRPKPRLRRRTSPRRTITNRQNKERHDSENRQKSGSGGPSNGLRTLQERNRRQERRLYPHLANVPSNLFGIAACLPDGDVVAVGDVDYKFGIESVSKVPTAILAMNQYSGQEVLDKIGADATGLPSTRSWPSCWKNDHPSTPLVNAGAISACSMVKPVGDSDGKWKAIASFIADLAGSEVEVIDELYKSETATNFNNKSIAWLLKNYNRIYDDPDMALDIYTRQCSIGVTAKQLATMAATIANSGVNPVTKKEVFKPELTPKIASMMATVGFYEHTGDWLFTTGLPAKTGVGGGIMGVVPGVMGVAAFAPRWTRPATR